MAFYAYNSAREAVQSIGSNDRLRTDGVGAYYAYDATHEAVQPVNGLSGRPEETLSDEALRQVVGTRRPLLVAGEWAIRVTDITWKAPTTSDELTLIPITDQEVARVRQAAFGHELPGVGFLTPALVGLQEAEGALVGTPYAFDHMAAIYAIGDRRPVPEPLFLVMARLRDADDREGGTGALAHTAATLQARLVYPVALPAKGPRRPLPPIVVALAKRPKRPATSAPRAPGAPPPPATPDVINLGMPPQQGFEQSGVLGGLGGLGALPSSGLLVGGAIALALGVGAAVYFGRR